MIPLKQPFPFCWVTTKAFYNLRPLIELFFVLAFHLHFCNLCQVLSAISTLFADCLAVWNRTEWLTINLMPRWVPAFWCGTPSEFPFSPLRLRQYVLKQIYAPISCLAFISRHGCFAISGWFGRYGSVTLLCSFSRTGGDRNLAASPPHSLPLPLG